MKEKVLIGMLTAIIIILLIVLEKTPKDRYRYITSEGAGVEVFDKAKGTLHIFDLKNKLAINVQLDRNGFLEIRKK